MENRSRGLTPRIYHTCKKSPYVRSYLKKEELLQKAATGSRDEALSRGRHMTHVRETILCAIYHMGLPTGNHYIYRAPSPSIPGDLKGHASRFIHQIRLLQVAKRSRFQVPDLPVWGSHID